MSPAMQDSKFEVIMSSESDLEEGEIPEIDYATSKTQYEDGEISEDNYTLKYSQFSGTKFKMKHRREILGDHYRQRRSLKNDSRKFKDFKKDYNAACRSSSSDRDYISEPKKAMKSIEKHSVMGSQEHPQRKSKRKHALKGSYGTVEDIMSQIDQTLCRKSRGCERRKLNNYNSDRGHRAKSPLKESRPKCRHNKFRRSGSSDSDSENIYIKSKNAIKDNIIICKRKRRKEANRSKEIIYLYSDNSMSDNEDDGTSSKRKCTEKEKRDFDEYRKQLLEKLSKEKSESKLQTENIPLPDEEELSNCSDIQEIEMIDDTNTFIDDITLKENKTSTIVNNSTEASGKTFMDTYYVTRDVSQSASQPEESENEDDDTELIKLRLLALTSNRKKKDAQISDDASSHSLDMEQSSNVDAKSEENSLDLKEENGSDLDRNEFLLRAEALKTALLKKHQKRIKKTTESIKNDSSNGKDSEKINFENSKAHNFNFLKEENEKLNMGEELVLKIKTDVSEIVGSLPKHNATNEIEGNSESSNIPVEETSIVDVENTSTVYDVLLNVGENNFDVLNKPKDLSSLEIARRKLPLTLEKIQESSSLEIARRKLPIVLEKSQEISNLEIARRKLLEVRNALNQKSVSSHIFPNQEDPPKDSLQARLLALANKSSIPKLLPSNSYENHLDKPDISQNVNLVTPPANTAHDSTEKFKDNSVTKRNRRLLKRKRWREKRRIQRQEALLNASITSDKNSTNSTKLEEDDEKLRVQLLNDLGKKKMLNEVGDKNVIDKPELPNSGPNEVEKKEPLNKQVVDIRNKNKINSKATVLPKVPKAEIKRLIIHLGPDSSDEDLEAEDKSRNLLSDKSGNKTKDKASSEGTVPKVPLPIDIEKSVDLLLQKARQEADGKQEKNKNINININATPEAVYKHLPPSQRLEYIRLKQKIAEKENLKKKNIPADNSANQSDTSSTNNFKNSSGTKQIVAASIQSEQNGSKSSPKSSNQELRTLNDNENSLDSVGNEKTVILENSKNSPSPVKHDNTVLKMKEAEKNTGVSSLLVPSNNLTSNFAKQSPVKAVTPQKIKSPVVALKKGTSSPSSVKKTVVSEEQKKFIVQNQANIARLKLLLKNIKIEKTLEEKYEKEIQKLKSQLNLLELKRKQQRLKIEKLAKESKVIYAACQSSRGEKRNLASVQQESTNGNIKEKEILPKNKDSDEIRKESAKIMDVVPESSEKTENVCEVKVQTDLETIRDVAVEEQKDEEREVKDDKKIDSITELNAASLSSLADLKDYKSPLQVFSARTEDSDCKRIDPNAIMCQYDLLGKCNDEECTFQHYRTS